MENTNTNTINKKQKTQHFDLSSIVSFDKIIEDYKTYTFSQKMENLSIDDYMNYNNIVSFKRKLNS